ncbi:hypothetical protein F4677DRAFT_445878 [Hypoxylon crocopeplum]|nr:hypothetical protein F4677DRAFT_445878 [Hypoxylon crocopeplum]
MPVLTRKRKAELEAAAEQETQIQEQLDAEIKQAAHQHRPKRQCTDPFKRTDPFRPRSPPPNALMRRSGLVSHSGNKPQRPLPLVFFTVPAANPEDQIFAKGRSSNDVDTIMVIQSLFDHFDKYGVAAMPPKEALETWLDENKDEFVKAREDAAHRRTTQSTILAGEPQAQQPTAPVATEATIERAVRYACHRAAGFLRGAASVLEDPVMQERIDIHHQEQQQISTQIFIESDIGEGIRTSTHTELPRTRPVAPPLDDRFFHPNGQLQSVYKYLTAQIPLPRQWVRWAIKNGVHEVPGRGDICKPGSYIAEDTFDYDALYEAIHRGNFRTGKSEIDYYPEYWPMVEGRRDSFIADLALHRFPPCISPPPNEQYIKRRNLTYSDIEDPSPSGPIAPPRNDDTLDDIYDASPPPSNRRRVQAEGGKVETEASSINGIA